MTVDPMALARSWVRLVLVTGQTTPLTAVINSDHLKSDAPRPVALPYAAIIIDTDDTEGWSTPHGWAQDTAGWPAVLAAGLRYPYHLDQVLAGQMVVALYGDGSVERARLLRITLARPDVQEFFATNKFTVKVGGGVTVTNAADILDTTREARATAQFTISWAERDTSEIDAIETVVPVLTT